MLGSSGFGTQGFRVLLVPGFGASEMCSMVPGLGISGNDVWGFRVGAPWL